MADNKNNTGKWNSGYCNTGNWNSGYWNSGKWNSGYCNTGNWNSGYWNSGDRNTGKWNSGDRNTGKWNSGYCNTGDWNSGDWNSGDRNTGNWNSGNWNSGYCNTGQPQIRIFDKETDVSREDLAFPDFFYFKLTERIMESEMSDKEKEAYPSYVTTGGYLKCYTYHTAWRNSWDKTTEEDKKKVLDLPNWNNEKFKEISGIDVEKELRVGSHKEDFVEMTLEEIAKLKGIPVEKLRIKE